MIDAPRGGGDPLAPYVPRLVVDWLADEPEVLHRAVSGTCVFADISGFTKLTERLATRGKAGAEEMGDLLNATFEQLLTSAYDYGANLMKWGGDSVLLLFDGDGHSGRAAQASWGMQDVMRRMGRLQTSCGTVRLGMSIGVNTGEFDFFLVGSRHRELIVTGPAASATARMEKIAERGEVVLSKSTAAALPAQCVGRPQEEGHLLLRPRHVDSIPNRRPKRGDVDLGQAMCANLRDHLRAGETEHEHRTITVGFIEFSGTDELLAEHGVQALTDAVAYLVDAVEDAADANGATVLSSDVAEDGGKIIITSGAPIATGDDETRVLSTVRRVVHPGGRLSLRGGVTCGSVFAGDYGPFYRKTYSITGDVVNLAARLMAEAQPGQVLATPVVVARSRTPFATTSLEPFAVKGKTKPVEAVAVGDQRTSSAEPVEVERLPLVGRDHELSVLTRAAQRSAEGRGEVVEIVAPPGMGKSRLLEELVARAGIRSLWFDGDIYSRNIPYYPMHRVLRHTLALPPDVADVAVASTLTDLVAGTAPDLLPWLPLIGIVAGVELPSTPEIEILDPDVRRARLEAVTSDLLGRLLRNPLILVVNDVHFMDEATVSLVRRLAADLLGRPWLMVATRRPEAPPPIDMGEHVESIELGPLPAIAIEQLLSTATSAAPLPPHRIRDLVKRAGGNPLFLTMLAAGASAGADLDDLPDTVEALIAAQIDRLPLRRRRWLRAASVLGMAIDPPWLRGVLAGTDLAEETWSGLEEFITLGIDQRLHFSHHLIRLTAYEGLPYRRRVELHARAVDFLETLPACRTDQAAALLSIHCLRGERFASAWSYARIAGERARDQYAVAEAAECYRRALEAAVQLRDLDRAERASVWESLADASVDLGESDEVERSLRQARGVAREDSISYARLCRKTAGHRQSSGRHANAIGWVSRGRTAISGRDDPAALQELAALASQGAKIRQDQANYRSANGWIRRAVEEAQRSGNAAVLAEARAIRLVLRALSGRPWNATEVTATLELIDESGSLRTKGLTANAIGMCAYFAGRWDEARDYYEQAEDALRRTGHDFGAAVSAANRAEILVQQARSGEAKAVLQPALRVLVAAKATSFVSFALALYARAAMLEANYHLAIDRLGEARALAAQMGETDEALSIQAFAAECLVLAGAPEAALDVIERARDETAAALDTLSAEPGLHRARGAALVAIGRTEEGFAALRQALRAAETRFCNYEIQDCLAALLRAGAASDELEAMSWNATRLELADTLGILVPESEVSTAS